MLIALKVVYLANILVAGWISITAIFFPERALVSIFEGTYEKSALVQLVGCLWLSIAILSVLGLWRPISFSPILLVQLIYKGTWLLVVALPAIRQKEAYPSGMAVFFLVWVLVLPFVIPWSEWTA